MDPRARALVATLGLLPHPEGGHYREIFRSADAVRPADGRGERAALTTIHFLLTEGERSRWHRVTSDEVWHHYEGAPLELVTLPPDAGPAEAVRLGAVGEGVGPVHVVHAGHWQAARSTGAYTLVGCTVGPGFDFADFRMLAEPSEEADALRARCPEFAAWFAGG